MSILQLWQNCGRMSHNHSAHLKSQMSKKSWKFNTITDKNDRKDNLCNFRQRQFFVYNLRVKILNRRFPPTVQQCQAQVCRFLLTTRRPGSIGEQRGDGSGRLYGDDDGGDDDYLSLPLDHSSPWLYK